MIKYYFIDDNNNKQGPYYLEELIMYPIHRETLVWHEGLGDWTKATEIKNITILLGSLPPKPPVNLLSNVNSTQTNNAQLVTNEKISKNNEVNNVSKGSPNISQKVKITDIKVIGGIGAILTILNIYPTTFGLFFSVVGYIMMLISFYKLSRVYKDGLIFTLPFLSMFANVVSMILLLMFVIDSIIKLFNGGFLMGGDNIMGGIIWGFVVSGLLIILGSGLFAGGLNKLANASGVNSLNVSSTLFYFLLFTLILFGLYLIYIFSNIQTLLLNGSIRDFTLLLGMLILIFILNLLASIFLIVGFFSLPDYAEPK